MKFKEECEGYGIAYLRSDPECKKCDFSLRCKFETEKKFKKEDKKIMGKLVKEMKKIKKKADLEEFIEENDLEDYIDLKKSDSIAKMKKKIEDAIKEKEEEGDEDDDDDDDSDDDDDDDDGDDGDDGDDDDDDDDDDEEDGDDDDDDDSEEGELEARILELEEKVEKLEKLLSTQPKSRKMSTQDKEDVKAVLLKKTPYTEKTLGKLNGREVKFLASALGVKSFGKSRKDVVKEILKSKKNKKKK